VRFRKLEGMAERKHWPAQLPALPNIRPDALAAVLREQWQCRVSPPETGDNQSAQRVQ